MSALQPAWWARLSVRLATSALPPGAERTRYRQELLAEQWRLSTREQAGHAWRVLTHAFELRGALAEAGRLPPHSHLWCRVRLHHDWHRETTEDGGRFRHCRACGLDDDSTLNQSFDGWMGAHVGPTNQR
jgi:hypothetical protein